MRVLLVKAVDGEEKKGRATASQCCDFGDLREIHTELLNDAGIDYELATFQTLTGFVVATIQHAAGFLQLFT
jgi:hypothetical protein